MLLVVLGVIFKDSQSKSKAFFPLVQVQVVDVVSTDRCVCQTEEGKLLEGEKIYRISICILFRTLSLLFLFCADVPQAVLETVVPKTQDTHVRVVRGRHRGQVSGCFSVTSFDLQCFCPNIFPLFTRLGMYHHILSHFEHCFFLCLACFITGTRHTQVQCCYSALAGQEQYHCGL